MSHGSGIFNPLASPAQPRLHFHSFTKWPFKASMQALSDTALPLEVLLNHGGRWHSLSACASFLTLMPAPHGQHRQVRRPACNGVEPHRITFAAASFCWCLLGTKNSLDLFFFPPNLDTCLGVGFSCGLSFLYSILIEAFISFLSSLSSNIKFLDALFLHKLYIILPQLFSVEWILITMWWSSEQSMSWNLLHQGS